MTAELLRLALLLLVSAPVALSLGCERGSTAPNAGSPSTTAPRQRTAPRTGPPLYRVTLLGLLKGGYYAKAVAINNRGEIVGDADTGNLVGERGGFDVVYSGENVQHGFLWADGTMRDLGDLDGKRWTWTSDINDSGQILGIAKASASVEASQGFLWRDGRLTKVMNGKEQLSTHEVNNAGQAVVGLFGRERSFLWQDGKATPLGDPYGHGSNATCVSNHGVVAGSTWVSRERVRAFLWREGKYQLIGPANKDSGAVAINDAGQVCLGVTQSPAAWDAYLYSEGKLTRLKSLGGPQCSPSDLNNSGDVVGTSTLKKGDKQLRAFVHREGKTWDLNDLVDKVPGRVLQKAVAINDSGQIAVNGILDRKDRAFLLTPD